MTSPAIRIFAITKRTQRGHGSRGEWDGLLCPKIHYPPSIRTPTQWTERAVPFAGTNTPGSGFVQNEPKDQ